MAKNMYGYLPEISQAGEITDKDSRNFAISY